MSLPWAERRNHGITRYRHAELADPSHRAGSPRFLSSRHRVDPEPQRLAGLIARYRGASLSWVPLRILELAATPTRPDAPGKPSVFTRHSTSLRLSWLCFLNHVSEETCLELMYALWDGMEQPERDSYPAALIDRMVQDTYRKGDPSKLRQSPQRAWGTDSDSWRATPRAFEMPVIDTEDPDRVRTLWDKGFAAIPVPSGEKGSSRNPKFAHLKTSRPTEAEFQKFSRGWYKQGNAALLFGNENEGIHRLYDIEIEHWEDFWNGDTARRDYFMSNTPVMKSAKSAHIFFRSKEVVHTTKVDGIVEFRGSNNYTMAPGSIHPSSTPAHPVIYQQINTWSGSILDVENVEAFVHRWVPELFAPQSQSQKPSPARTPSSIRAGDGFVEQSPPIKVEQPAAETQGVARRAAVWAAQYTDYCIDMIPMPQGVTPRGGSCIMQRKDNPLHLATTAGASQTWQEEGNAVLMRRTRLGFYLALLFKVVEEEDGGAIYHYRRHLSPEIWKENWGWLKRLRARINAHGKDQVEFCVLEEDGWWLNVFSDYDDPRGRDTEPSVAAREDLGPLLVGLGMPDREFHKKTPVYASKAWKMPKSRTNEWRILGLRSVPDLLSYSAVEDARDAQIAIEGGLATYLATGEEIMGRAPEAIQHTRHFLAPLETQPWEMLEFADRLGFFLFPKIQAELERERGAARAAKRAKPAMAPRPSPMPVTQGKFI